MDRSNMISPLLPSSEGGDDNVQKSIDNSNIASLPINHFPDPDFDNPTALETSQWWAEYTSIHGLYYMLERGHFQLWKRVVWSIIVLTAFWGLIVALVAEFDDFFEYNVDTATKTIIPASLDFPQVTLCNANGGVDASLQNSTGIKEPKNEEELMAISQPLKEFILHTEFNQKVYAVEELWTPVITPLGLCFSFVTDEKVFIPGISAGLLVWTWLDQASYPAMAEMAGVHVFVNPTNSYNDGKISFQSSGSIVVPPGDLSSAAITRQDFQREEEEPWAKCLPVSNEIISNSIEQCRMECIMATTKEKCHCRVMGDNDSYYNYCNSTDLKCQSLIGDLDLALCGTCAVPPCKEQVYSTRYSAGRVSRKLVDYLETERNASHDEITSNFVSIHINYDSIRYEKTTESKSTSTWQLVSNLGGNFGFFMGISMISIVELCVELFALRLLPRLWGKKRLYGVGQKKYD